MLRFQSDADLNPHIIRGLLRKEPSIDFQLASAVYPPATPDPIVLKTAAEQGRVLVSRDVNTMIVHFEQFISKANSPGLILIPSDRTIGEIVEGLLLLWAIFEPEDMLNRVEWLPLSRE